MKKLTILSLLVFICLSFTNAQSVYPVAGNGTSGYTGDGSLAISAEVSPNGVAKDSKGNIYITDENNNVLRMIDTNGVITTIAGTGNPGHAGDGGYAINATLFAPNGVAVDKYGNIYISEGTLNGLGNVDVREIDNTGIITTIAGTPGNIYGGYTEGTPATANSIYPYGVAVDINGNVYIADYGDEAIRMVDASGNIHTIAGGSVVGFSGDGGPATAAKLNAPAGVAVDKSLNIYFADSQNQRIRKVSNTGIITTIAGNGTAGFSGDGGAATVAKLSTPAWVSVDSAGANVYIA
ncbi:MAG TPA: hypothetical protein VK890_06730, partial [Bacteroidia bacterium]|nr:hypothetical protein [Bacteroidia bacterium]